MFLHIDIDSFFASAERSVDATLKGIPMAVGSRSNLEIFNKKRTNIRLINDNSGAFVTPIFYSDKQKTFDSYFVDKGTNSTKIRGIITTSSYEARAFGVKTAMPIAQALSLCPRMVVVPSNYLLYHRISQQIHTMLQKEVALIEQYSIDEFFCDLSGWIEDEDAYTFAQEIQQKIDQQFDIPVSIGISQAKWIAKLATESAKPYGIFEVKNITQYIEEIPIKKFPGIGSAFQKKLQQYYITKLGDIEKHKTLFYSWKKPGIQLYKRVLGIDGEGINPKGERKSIGISRTFDTLYDSSEVRRRIIIIARHIVYMVMAIKVNPTLYYLKLSYEYGIRAKKSLRVDRIFSESLFKMTLIEMYESIHIPQSAVIKLSVSVSHFTSSHPKTLSLLELEYDMAQLSMGETMHNLRERFGLDIIKNGSEL